MAHDIFIGWRAIVLPLIIILLVIGSTLKQLMVKTYLNIKEYVKGDGDGINKHQSVSTTRPTVRTTTFSNPAQVRVS